MARRKPTTIARPDSLGGIYAAKHGIAAYHAAYEKGWRAGASGTENGPFQTGGASDAYEDGYLDAGTGREKWHLANCPLHDNGVPGGCDEA